MAVARVLPRPALRRPPSANAPATTQVIALANQKGGVAKTTTTLNLGVAFAERGLRVLCIDLDPQGNLTMSQGMNPDTIERSMFDVLVHRHADRRGDRARARSTSPSPRSTSPAPTWRSRARSAASARCRRRSSRSRTRYDYILIDTPPSLGLLTINAFVAATGVIVPVQTEYLSLRGLVQLENTLQMVRDNLNPAGRDHRDPADDVRPAPDALARGRRDPARELRRRSSTRPASARRSATPRRR